MNDVLGGLESKVTQVISLCAELRAENHRLRDRIGALEEKNVELSERMTAARTRLENLMDHLPLE